MSSHVDHLDMQGYRIERLGNGVASTDAAAIGQTPNSVTVSGNGLVAKTGTSAYSARTITATTDVTSITNGDGVSGNPTIDLATRIKGGWIAPGATWTYASASTFTISGDWTDRIGVGTKAWLTQTTSKFFYVTACSHSAGTTTVTVNGGSDHSLANAAITAPYFSNDATPVGFPHWFNWTPSSFTGFSSNPSSGIYRFTINGRLATVVVRMPNNGTSNSTAFSLVGPLTAASGTNRRWLTVCGNSADNGVATATPAVAFIEQASSTISLWKDASGAGWTAANAKGSNFTLEFEI